MTTKDFVEMILDERIKMLLTRKPSENGLEITEAGEKIIMELEEGTKDKLEAYMELLTDNMAQNERKAYIGGLKDEIWLAREIERLNPKPNIDN